MIVEGDAGADHVQHDCSLVRDRGFEHGQQLLLVAGERAAYKRRAQLDGQCAGVDGRQIPRGIFAGDDIAAASLVGGDVTPVPIIVAGVGATFDCSLLTIENGATIDTGLPSGQSVREALYALGMFAQDTIDFDVLEN